MNAKLLTCALLSLVACSSRAPRPELVPVGTQLSDKPSMFFSSSSAPACAFDQVPGVSAVDEHDRATTIGPGRFARRCDNGVEMPYEAVPMTGAAIDGPDRLRVDEQAFYDTVWESARGRHDWPVLADASGEHSLDESCAGIAELVIDPPSHGMGGLGHLHGIEVRGVGPGTCTVRVKDVVGAYAAEKTITVVP